MTSRLGKTVGSVTSVGDELETHQIHSVTHPAYVNFSNAVTEQLTKLAAREAVRLESARPLLLPFALTSDQRADLAEEYAEFAVTALPLSVPVHTAWVARRAAANEWVSSTVQRYGTSSVHYGGSLLASMVSQRRGCHLETSLADDVAVHSYYGERVAAARVYEGAGTIAKETGIVLPRSEYDAHLRREAYTLCTSPQSCTHVADTMCVDASSIDVSPVQVAMAMAQHQASVCMGFFIYHPAMLVQDKGELEGTGVFFEKTSDTIHFRYPEGRVGVASYSRSSWAKWCLTHSFVVGDGVGVWYQLELLKRRGVFMFFRIVRLPDEVVPQGNVSHALDVSQADEHVLVKSWRLQNGFLSKPDQNESWVPAPFLMRARVAERAYTFAMQLPNASFSRHSIKKQIRVVNNRWVVQGSVVSVAPALDPQQIEDFVTAVYVRAFVDRYDSSRLSSEMMTALSALAGFSDVSTARRVAVVGKAVVRRMYLATFGKVDAAIRSLADAIREYLQLDSKRARSVGWAPAPTYHLMVGSALGDSADLQCDFATLARAPDAALGIECCPDGPGGLIYNLYASYSRKHVSRDGGPGTVARDLTAVMRVVTDVVSTSTPHGEAVHTEFVGEVARLNPLDSAGNRHLLEFKTAEREAAQVVEVFRDGKVDDPVGFLNQLYLDVLPGVAKEDMSHDTFSLSLDPQDRTLAAPYLRMPTYFGLPPTPRSYYLSKLKALSVPKRQNTAQELLTAVAARNLSAPAISQPQDDELTIRAIWNNFLDVACVPDAREKLARYQTDVVALEADALLDWAKKAKPEVVDRLTKEMQEFSTALGDKSVKEYLVMIKSDVKPTMSDKPLRELTAPQVIVYHDKLLSALYSSMFRVLVRRFLSLLKPNYHVNLLKDTRDIAAFLTAVHPFDVDTPVRYLENDFSKYDKSQSEFAFLLEEFVFRQLGLNREMLDAWQLGHVECSLRSVSLGMSLHVLYQRKSGDATTAFGNVILNVLSVLYAYQGTQVLWGVFMGDDSIIAASKVGAEDRAVAVLAEVFNLTAKFYITDAPYFASNFIHIDKVACSVTLIPDIIKRIERLSMSISADDPQWEERYVSFCDSMGVFARAEVCTALCMRVPLRYQLGEGFVRGAAASMGALVKSFVAFRSLWDESPTILQA